MNVLEIVDVGVRVGKRVRMGGQLHFPIGLVLRVDGVNCHFGIFGLIVGLGGHVGVEPVGDRSKSIKVA